MSGNTGLLLFGSSIIAVFVHSQWSSKPSSTKSSNSNSSKIEEVIVSAPDKVLIIGGNSRTMPLKCNNPECEKSWTLRCTACKSVGYCGTSCQRIDWLRSHKIACKAIRKENQRKMMEARVCLLQAVENGDLNALRNYVETTESNVN